MVSLSIMGMTGWVNPFFLAARRPWTLFVARRRSAGAFFCGTPRGFDFWGLRRGGEAHGGETPRVTLQDGTRAIQRTARPGCSLQAQRLVEHARHPQTEASLNGDTDTLAGGLVCPRGRGRSPE
jgi:hypothetical protein